MLQTAGHAKIGGVVDHGLDAERAAVLEVLLDAGVLVAKVDPHLGAARHDPGSEPVAGASGLAGEHERHLFGAADADVVLDERLEERAGAAG